MKTSWWKLDEEQDINTKYLLITEIKKKSTSGETCQTTPQSNNENEHHQLWAVHQETGSEEMQQPLSLSCQKFITWVYTGGNSILRDILQNSRHGIFQRVKVMKVKDRQKQYQTKGD